MSDYKELLNEAEQQFENEVEAANFWEAKARGLRTQVAELEANIKRLEKVIYDMYDSDEVISICEARDEARIRCDTLRERLKKYENKGNDSSLGGDDEKR